MPHPTSHKNTIVWLWASHVTAPYDEFGTAIRKIRARGDMPRLFPSKRHMLNYLVRIGMDEAAAVKAINDLYASYVDFYNYVKRSTAPAGTPIPPEVGSINRKKTSNPTDLDARIKAFVRVDGRVDFSRAQLLAEANGVWTHSMCSMSAGLLTMTLKLRLTSLVEARGFSALKWPDNADVLNWEHAHGVRRDKDLTGEAARG